jgi:hypothetical protein
MMEAARTSETLVNFYQTTRCYNPEDSHLHTHRRENLKSYMVVELNKVCERNPCTMMDDFWGNLQNVIWATKVERCLHFRIFHGLVFFPEQRRCLLVHKVAVTLGNFSDISVRHTAVRLGAQMLRSKQESPTTWSRISVEKLIVTQLHSTLTAFYGAHPWVLSWAGWI